MNETKFTQEIRNACTDGGGYSIKIAGSMMQMNGTPDVNIFYKGSSFMIESKVGSNKMSKVQVEVVKRIREGTGSVWCAAYKNERIYLDTGESFDSCVEMLDFMANSALALATRCQG